MPGHAGGVLGGGPGRQADGLESRTCQMAELVYQDPATHLSCPGPPCPPGPHTGEGTGPWEGSAGPGQGPTQDMPSTWPHLLSLLRAVTRAPVRSRERLRGVCVCVLASIRQMSRQVSRGSAGEYQADEQAGVARLRWRVSGR